MNRQEPDIFLCLGSNLGDRAVMLQRACDLIEKDAGSIIRCSSVYESEPWRMKEAEPFLNQVIRITSSLSPDKLLLVLKEVELKLGKVESPRSMIRDIVSPAYYSRSIDIDILFYGNKVIDFPELVIPHPYIADRRFVLVPMVEIAVNFMHPVLGKPIQRVLEECRDFRKVRVFC